VVLIYEIQLCRFSLRWPVVKSGVELRKNVRLEIDVRNCGVICPSTRSNIFKMNNCHVNHQSGIQERKGPNDPMKSKSIVQSQQIPI
jgi:hypothetical protein